MLGNQLKVLILNLKDGLISPLKNGSNSGSGTNSGCGAHSGSGVVSGWSDDGLWVYYTRQVAAKWQLWRYNLAFDIAEPKCRN
jgi:hypothetical protein